MFKLVDRNQEDWNANPDHPDGGLASATLQDTALRDAPLADFAVSELWLYRPERVFDLPAQPRDRPLAGGVARVALFLPSAILLPRRNEGRITGVEGYSVRCAPVEP